MVIPLGDVERAGIVPVVTYVLIALNVAMYAVQVARGPEFTVAYAATPWEITHNQDLPGIQELARAGVVAEDLTAEELSVLVELKRKGVEQSTIAIPVLLTLITAMFLHGGPLHLAGNMLYLWIFGDNVEEVVGRWRYVLAYLGSGLVGSLCQIVAAPDSLVPTLGASGAIAGIMGMYLVWFPRNRVRVLLIRVVVEVRAVWVIGPWLVLQALEGLHAFGEIGKSGGVAYLAHVGGGVTGVVVGALTRRRARESRRLVPWYHGRARPPFREGPDTW